jgi:uncharacterized membrane protein (UPF0127 family)
MGKIINIRTSETILDDLQTAETFLTRFRGLMGAKSLAKNTGLRIAPCNSVHCFFMRFPIDVIFLDKENQVIHIQKNMKPGSISPIIRKAKSVIEANADTLSNVLELGDKLAFYD